MLELNINDLNDISAGGVLGSVAGGVLGFNAGLVVGLGAWAVSGDENAVLGCAHAGAGVGFYAGAVAPTP